MASSSIDSSRLDELIEESQDLQSDSRRASTEVLPALEERHRVLGDRRPTRAERQAFDLNRRSLLGRLGLGTGGVVAVGGGFGALMASLLAKPAAADRGLDVQILQTASSLEKLAVATYQAALGLPFISGGNQVVVKFAQTTMMQHDEHKKAFQRQTTALQGQVQDAPNPKYATVVEQAKANLKGPIDVVKLAATLENVAPDVVKLAATLENVARDTYLADLAMFEDKESRVLMATVMGVETQHLATLRAVQALLEGNAPQLIAIPTDVTKLPAAAGSVGFPEAIPQPKLASPPAEGALK